MAKRFKMAGILTLLGMHAGGCTGPSAAVDPGNAQPAIAADRSGGTVRNQAPINERFRSLDEYLVFLERTQGPVDGPWYREIRPGVYELVTGNLRVLGADPNAQKRTFTRQELMQQFGFTR